MRELLTEQELALVTMLIQGEFLNHGVSTNDQVETFLFPGKYVHHLYQHRQLFKAQPLSFDQWRFHFMVRYLHQSGLSLGKISRLCLDDFVDLSQSHDWKTSRDLLLSQNFHPDEELPELANIKSHLEKYHFQKKQHGMDNVKLASTFPTSWMNAALGFTGSTSKTSIPHAATTTINVSTHQLLYRSQSLVLEKPYIVWLSLLSDKNHQGLHISALKQLDVEGDLIKRLRFNSWRAFHQDCEELRLARLNRINVAKSRLNKKLEPLGLKIHVQKGSSLWQLITLHDHQAVNIRVTGESWFLKNKSNAIRIPSARLSQRQKQLCDYFLRRHASFVSSKAIALELDVPDASSRQISDILYKFKKKLNGTSYYLIKNYQGDYSMQYKRQKKTQISSYNA